MATTTRKPAAKSAARKAAPQAADNPKLAAMQAEAEQDRNGLTPAQRKALAQKVIRARVDGTKWDGDGGICQTLGVKNALVGRALMREFGAPSHLIQKQNRLLNRSA